MAEERNDRFIGDDDFLPGDHDIKIEPSEPEEERDEPLEGGSGE